MKKRYSAASPLGSVFLFLFVAALGGYAQSAGIASSIEKVGGIAINRDSGLSDSSLSQGTVIPKTYSAETPNKSSPKKEAALWRIAVISAGSLPFTIFYCDFIFDSVGYVSSGFNSAYAPWPFRSQYSASISTQERFERLGVSAAMSLCIGILGTLIK